MPENPRPEDPSPEHPGDEPAVGRHVDPTGGPDETDEPPRPSRAADRRLSDLLRPGRGQVVVALILGLLATTFVLQVRARQADHSYSTARRPELIQLVDGLDTEARRLESEVRELEETRRRLETDQGSADVALSAGRARLDELAILAGTAPAAGPGVRITLQDPRRRITPATLLDAVEEMRDAGAEAIEVNDTIRIIGSTWIGGTTGATTIGGRGAAGTIVFDVIGDPHALEEAARFRGGLASEVTAPDVGGAIQIERYERVEVQSLHAPVPHQYARPAR